MGEWTQWHRGYAENSGLSRRLEAVQRAIARALDQAPFGPIRVLSLCAGDGRDLLGVLRTHPRAPDVQAHLIETDPELRTIGEAAASAMGVRRTTWSGNDAGNTSSYLGAVPADLHLLCGIFGNVSGADIERTIRELPHLSRAGATVIWTRGRWPPDATPSIRRWVSEAGFEELDFYPVPETLYAVGSARLRTDPRPYRPGRTLFTFLPPDQRPSRAPGPKLEPGTTVATDRP